MTVTPVALGTTRISLTQTGNTTGYTIDLAPATFDVTVNPPANSAPTVKVTGVTSGQAYAFGTVPSAACDVSDAEDGTQSVAPSLSAISGPNAASGIGSQTATCSYTDRGGLTATATATYSIVQASSTTTVTCPSTATTYTGSALTPCTATVTGTGGLSTSLPVTYGANTAAGTATASASFAGSVTHSASNGSATFVIAKAGSSTTVTCPSAVSWTGSALTPCTARVTGAGSLDSALTPTYSSNTAVGTAKAAATFAGDANHTASSDSKSFSIQRAASVVSVTCPTGQVYSGAALTPCTAKVSSIGGFEQTLPVTYSDNVGAGTATASAAFAGDDAHAAAGDSATFAIAKAPSSVDLSCTPTTVTYTGQAQTPCTATATGAGITTPVALTVAYADNTDAGTATVTARWAGDANHTPSDATTTFTIAQAPSTVSLVCPASHVYTGAAITPCSASVDGAGFTTQLALDPSYDHNILVGTARASAGWAGDANHTGDSASATFDITKAASTVTITCDTTPVVFTGAAQQPCSAEATGAGIDTPVTLTPGYTDNTNAGTAGVTAAWDGDDNHTGNAASSSFVIQPAASSVKVTCPTTQLTYSGAAQTPCTARATGAGGLDADVPGVTYTDNVNAGTATAWATYTGDDNHVGDSGSATFAIGRATPVVTVDCPDAATYDGTPHTCTATVTGVGTELDGATASIDYGTTGNVDAGDVSVIATYTAPASGNYSDGEGRGEFTIAQATPVVTLTCPDDATYDAADHPCTATVKGVGDELASATAAITYGAHGNVNAGEVTATATFTGGGNYTDATTSKTYAIARFQPTVDVQCPTSATYDASAHLCTATVKGVSTELDGADVALDYGTHGNVDAGDVTATGSFAGDANHAPASNSASFTIDKAKSAVAVTCTQPVTYTGSPVAVCSASVTGVGGLNSPVDVTYTDNVNAGTATAWATFDGDANHAGSSGDKAFTISKAKSEVTVTCPTDAPVYTGAAIEPCSATVTGVGGLNKAVSPVTYTNNVNTGTAAASASYAGDTNHEASLGGASFTIAKAGSTVTVSCPESRVYTGLALTPCTAAVSGAGGLTGGITPVVHTDNVDVGTASARADFAGDANHNGSTGGATFSITKAASTVAVSCPASMVYTGSALTPCSATLTGPGLQATGLTVSYSNNTGAGSASASATWAGDSNHVGASDSQSFAITRAPSNLEVSCPASVTYDGSALQPCTATLTGAGLSSSRLPVQYTDNVNAGTAHASAAWAGDDNHTGTTGSGSFTIAKATPVVTVTCPNTVVFDGTAHACTASVKGVGTELDGVNPVLAYGPGNVNAGDVTATATFAGGGNYEPASGTGAFTIDKAASAVTIACAAGPFVWTGAAFTPCTAKVSGVAMADVALTPVYSNNTNVGTATVSASWAGDINHRSSTNAATFTIAAWRFGGFYQPVDMGNVLNTVKGGSTVPLKFEIFSGSTELTSTSSVKSFMTKTINCASVTTALTDDIELTTTGGTSLRYDSTAGQFIQNWQTPKTAGVCYQVTMTTQDGSTLSAYFKTK
ncbi:PxKF domain-containing protein [Intrasporangium sp. YIM S08009]|uniref:PxKF domain-containing protein n=1 Tax=Intrasporangium zincisolvens TaxID=3080018 RepID=UPI002B05B81E|nr:PxKF domain-containing protein [Intrasporangium sp. YIM S08009]